MRIGFLALLLFPALAGARPAPPPAPVAVTLPSALPGGSLVNDRILLTFYPAGGTAGRPAPAAVLLHPLGEQNNRMMARFARFLSARGVGGAVMILPYHMGRLPPRDYPLRHYITTDLDRAIGAFGQSVADVRAVVDWLDRQPSVDPGRVGVIGVSLGAIVAHLAMGQDERLAAGVAILGGGDLADLYRRSALFRVVYPLNLRRPTPEDLERLRQIDPLTYAGRNRPRRVLMIQAARDLLVLPADATLLWKALGRPPIRWLDTNHFAPALAEREIMQASLEYLLRAWADPAYDGRGLPSIHAPTLKMGLLFGPDFDATFGLAWQAVALGRRSDHMSLLHADLGWSGRGFFVGLAATLNPSLDIGVARRFNGRRVDPYVSLHIVF